MKTIAEVERRREEILKEMRGIRSMKRGTVNEQYLPVRHKGKKEPILRGPYYVFSRREGKRTVSCRLSKGAEVDRARSEIAAHKRFRELCREFEELTEQLGELIRQGEEDSREKKLRRSRSRRTRR